jgi:NADH:ubiquinone oxidoreductase subunit 3 (subunit A)
MNKNIYIVQYPNVLRLSNTILQGNKNDISKSNMIEYGSILTFIVFAVILSAIIPAASYILGVKNSDNEKASVFECGFDPFGDSRQQFEVRFFLVAILFIIFDLEISFLFP